MKGAAILLDAGSPLPARLMPGCAFQAGSAGGTKLSVALVLGARCEPKVTPPIVSAIAVRVVNLIRRPRAPSHPIPREPVREIAFLVNADLSI